MIPGFHHPAVRICSHHARIFSRVLAFLPPACAALALLLSLPQSARAQALTSVSNLAGPDGTQDFQGYEINAIAVNAQTNKIYIALQNIAVPSDSGLVAVVSGSTYQVTALHSDPSASQPYAIAIDPITNVIYIANMGSTGSVTVWDGNTDTVAGNMSNSDENAGPPNAIVVDSLTNTVYAADPSVNDVSYYTGTIRNANGTLGTVGHYAGTIPVGSKPMSLAVSPAAGLLYVANSGSTGTNNVSVISTTGMTANTVVATVSDSSVTSPVGVAVDPKQGLAYVAGTSTSSTPSAPVLGVTVLSGSAYSTTMTASSANVVSNPASIAVNPLTARVYVSELGNGAGAVSVFQSGFPFTTVNGFTSVNGITVDDSTDTAFGGTSSSGVVVMVGLPDAFYTSTLSSAAGLQVPAVNPVTHKAFIGAVNSGNQPALIVVDGNNYVESTPTDPASAPGPIAVSPVANQVYVLNGPGSSNVFALNGSGTPLNTSPISVGMNPVAIAVNPVTNYIVVADNGIAGSINTNSYDGYSIIYGYSNGGPPNGTPENVGSVFTTMNSGPVGVVANPVNNFFYGFDGGNNGFTIIPTTTTTGDDIPPNGCCTGMTYVGMAMDQQTDQVYTLLSGPSSFALLDVDGADMFGYNPFSYVTATTGAVAGALAINPNTNYIYVALGGDGESVPPTLQVFTGGDVNPPFMPAFVPSYSGVTSPNSSVTTTVAPSSVAVNPVSNMVYVAGIVNGYVSVFSGATSNSAPAFVTDIHNGNPTTIVVNPVTNKIYVSANTGQEITVIDGASNTVVSQTTGSEAISPLPMDVNTLTNQLYGVSSSTGTLPLITEAQSQTNALTTAISPLTNNQSATTAPAFNFTVTNGLTNLATSACSVYYQADTWQGQWLPTTLGTNGFSPTNALNLTPGVHTIYAFATEGDDANSSGISTGHQSSPLIGAVASYMFVVAPPIAFFAPASNTPSNSTTLAFPPTVYGQQSAPISATLTNEGGSPLTITEYSYTPDWQISLCSGLTLDPTSYLSAPCTISITFNPTSSAGPLTGTVTVYDNSYSGGTQTITLAGNSIPTAPAITNEPSNPSSSSTAQFFFGSGIGGVTGFQCQLDSGSYQPCNSGNVTYNNLNNASHTFNVEALDSVGDVSAPATYTWMVSASSSFAVTVNLLGNGTGAVSDGTTALDCTETAGNVFPPCSNNYSAPVTLTETPGTDGSTFAGWGGACSGTATTCLVSSTATVTANFIPAPQMATLTYTTGSGVQTQQGNFDCGISNPTPSNPCPNPNAHNIQLAVQGVNSGFSVSVTATEVPPTMADGICESNNDMANGGVITDFDCRFLQFFNYGTDPSTNGAIVPLCYPYAHGNCIHYAINASAVMAGAYLGPVNWKITWNNDLTAPTTPPGYWAGSTPQLYDDPDQAPTPLSAQGTDCTTTMTLGNGGPTMYACQFEFDITTFFDANEPVDSGIGGSTKAFNDVVVAWPPTNTPTISILPLLNASSSPTAQTAPSGGSLSLTLTLTNIGTTAANSITLSDPLPSGSGVSWSISPAVPGCSIAGAAPSQTLNCTISSIVPGSGNAQSVTVVSSAASAGFYLNVATYTIDNQQTSTVSSITVQALSQTISFSTGAPAGAVYGSKFTVAATAPGGTVAFTSSGSCTNVLGTYTITSGSGTCSVIANQFGNSVYSAAPQITQSTPVSKANSATTITSNSPNPSTVNQAVTVGVKVTDSSAGSTGTPTSTVTVTATLGSTHLTCNATLSGGAGSCNVTPNATGGWALTAAYNGDSNFNTSTTASSTAQTVNAAASSLKFLPAVLNFGNVYVGNTALVYTTITNTGSSMVTFAKFAIAAISGDDSTGFLGIAFCPSTLNAGRSCTVIMSFTADFSVTKTHAANLVITDNGAGSPQTIPMSATVINPKVSLSASSINFGNQTTGTTSAAKSVTLTNSGTTQLNLTSLTISGTGYTLATGSSACTATSALNPGATCKIYVTFKPASPKGAKSGSVKIADNAQNSPQTIPLSGNGT